MRSSSLPSDGALPVEVRNVASRGSRASMSSSSRFSTPRWWRRSCSTSDCIAWSSRGELISPEYILRLDLGRPSRPATRASSSSCCSSRAMTSRSARVAMAGASSAAASRLGARQGLAFGQRLVTVQEPVERAVVLLEREELFELARSLARAVPAGGGGRRRGGGRRSRRRRSRRGRGRRRGGRCCCCTVGSCGARATGCGRQRAAVAAERVHRAPPAARTRDRGRAAAARADRRGAWLMNAGRSARRSRHRSRRRAPGSRQFPYQTAVASCGVAPMNQASAEIVGGTGLAEDVLTGRRWPWSRCRRSTTPRSTFCSHAATSGSSACVAGVLPWSKSTLPSGADDLLDHVGRVVDAAVGDGGHDRGHGLGVLLEDARG